MTLGFRRILYSLAIILFIAIAPALVLYTAGYRYSFTKNKIQITGSIFINAHPQDVEVYINNNLVDTTSPVRLNRLAPNNYDIRITKEGFSDWNKKLEVIEGKTTFADHVILWPENPQSSIVAQGDIKDFSLSTDEEKIVWQSDYEIFCLNTLSKKSEKIITLPNNSSVNFEWSNDNEKLIINQNNSYWLITFGNRIEINKFNTIDSAAQTIKFHPEISELIIFLKNNRLYTYNLITKDIKLILDDKIKDYRWHDGNWYFLTLDNPIILTHTNLLNIDENPPLFQLPIAENYSFVDIINNHALIYEKDSLTLYVFNLDPEKFNNTSQIIKPVKDWKINSEKNKLLLNNDWEAWVFDLERQNSEIITRVSDPIIKTEWYVDSNYLLIQYSDKLEIIELDNRDYRNKTIIWHSNHISNSILSNSGENLYILAQDQQADYEIQNIKINNIPLLGF